MGDDEVLKSRYQSLCVESGNLHKKIKNPCPYCGKMYQPRGMISHISHNHPVQNKQKVIDTAVTAVETAFPTEIREAAKTMLTAFLGWLDKIEKEEK